MSRRLEDYITIDELVKTIVNEIETFGISSDWNIRDCPKQSFLERLLSELKKIGIESDTYDAFNLVKDSED